MAKTLTVILAIAIAFSSFGVSDNLTALEDGFFHGIISRITMDMNYMLQLIDQLTAMDQGVASSPYSVILPLQVFVFFARGYSQRQLLDFLLNANQNWEPLRLIAAVEPTPKDNNVVTFVKRMFFQKDLKLTQHFVDVNNQIGVQFAPIDFQDTESAAREINSIVASDTGHRINGLIFPRYLDSKTEMMLVSALHVKGVWKCKFENRIGENVFYRDDDKTDMVPTMFQVDFIRVSYSEELQSTVLVLPFSDPAYDFVLIAPDVNNRIKKVSTQLEEDPSLLTKALDALKTYIVELTMPKFSVKTTVFMRRALENLGVTNIMDPRVSNLRDVYADGHDAYISNMLQTVTVDIYEEGVVASSATRNDHTNSSRGYGARPFDKVQVNKPFLYIIRQNGYDLIMGSYQGLVHRDIVL